MSQQVQAKDKILTMIKSSPETNDVSTLCHLLRSPSTTKTTTTIAPFINHTKQYHHYSIVKQRPSPPSAITKCHSSSPVTTDLHHHHHHHQHLENQAAQVNHNLYKQEKKLNFSIDAILNSGKADLIMAEGSPPTPPSHSQQLNSMNVRTVINNGQSDKGSPPKSGNTSTTKKLPPTGKGSV